jgi:hypothetical protein
MELNGPFKDTILLKNIPGPGVYSIKSALDHRSNTIGAKIPDKSISHLAKVKTIICRILDQEHMDINRWALSNITPLLIIPTLLT